MRSYDFLYVGKPHHQVRTKGKRDQKLFSGHSEMRVIDSFAVFAALAHRDEIDSWADFLKALKAMEHTPTSKDLNEALDVIREQTGNTGFLSHIFPAIF